MTCLTFASAFLLLGLASATCNQSDTLASSSISAILNEKTGVTCACNKLLRSYPSQVIFPGSANYTTQAIDIYWDIRAAMYPACVFMPTTANQVADAVVDMTSCNAQFAVRGGGHMNVESISLAALPIMLTIFTVSGGGQYQWWRTNCAQWFV